MVGKLSSNIRISLISSVSESLEEISCAGVECWKPENEDAEKAAAPVFAISAAKVPTVTIEYAGEPESFAPAGTDEAVPQYISEKMKEVCDMRRR